MKYLSAIIIIPIIIITAPIWITIMVIVFRKCAKEQEQHIPY